MKSVLNFRKKVSALFGGTTFERRRVSRGPTVTGDDLENPLRAELFSPEQLERHAQSLSAQHTISTSRRAELLLPRLKQNERIIDQTYELVTQMVRDGERMPPAAEWLLDNYYVIKEHVGLAHEHLPRQFVFGRKNIIKPRA